MSGSFEDFANELANSKTAKDLPFTVFKGTDISLSSHVPFGVPTRIPQLDLSLGRAGYPAGRIIEIFGFEFSGKSSAALSAIASAQRMGGYGLYIDTERTFDKEWARLNGCDPDQILVGEVDTVEGAFNMQLKALEAAQNINSTAPLVMVVDSVTAVPSLDSIDRGLEAENRIGSDARAIRNSLKKIVGKLAESKAVAIYVNHSVSKIASTPFAKQSQSSGGHGIKFWASVRLEFINCGTVKVEKNDHVYKGGIKVKVKIEKNKICTTGRMEVECELLNSGFDVTNNLFDALIDIGEIQKVNNRNYSFTIPGKDEVVQFSKAEFPAFVESHASSTDNLYKWFLDKSIKKGLIKPYA